jgi:hypothetical protein
MQQWPKQQPAALPAAACRVVLRSKAQHCCQLLLLLQQPLPAADCLGLEVLFHLGLFLLGLKAISLFFCIRNTLVTLDCTVPFNAGPASFLLHVDHVDNTVIWHSTTRAGRAGHCRAMFPTWHLRQRVTWHLRQRVTAGLSSSAGTPCSCLASAVDGCIRKLK